MPNATVTAVHAATNTQTATQSNAEGVYTLAQLTETCGSRRKDDGFRMEEHWSVQGY